MSNFRAAGDPVVLAVALLLVFSGCASRPAVNPAAPGIARLQTDNSKEQRHTQNAVDDVVDARDLVRRIDAKDALLTP